MGSQAGEMKLKRRLPYRSVSLCHQPRPGSLRFQTRLSREGSRALRRLAVNGHKTGVLDLAVLALDAAVQNDDLSAVLVAEALVSAVGYDEEAPHKLRAIAQGFKLLSCAVDREAVLMAEALVEESDE